MDCKKFIAELFRHIDYCFFVYLYKCNKNHNISNKILTDTIYDVILYEYIAFSYNLLIIQ